MEFGALEARCRRVDVLEVEEVVRHVLVGSVICFVLLVYEGV